MTLTVGSLFSGIGGLDLGLERAGMRVIWQSEIDPYATRVLAKHWPGVPNYGDITRINWGDVVRPDVICGGYPCQPFLLAGVRRGENDPRHLWPYVRDAIGQLRPRYAILENVRGHLSLGGLSVLSDLTALGYDAEWRIVSAASVGANHRRDRLIIVAYPTEQRWQEWRRSASGEVFAGNAGRRISNLGSVANWWKTEPDVGRVANGISNRVDRLKGLGNAVVPQVAEVIGRLVVAHNEQQPR